jgi:hypothetical protein
MPKSRKSVLNRLRGIADRVSKMHPAENAEIALMNLMAGALYALYQAAELGYDDSRATPNPDASMREFRHSAIKISKGLPPADGWLAGFFLNSALLRMAPLNERINKHTHTQHDIPTLRRLVNKIKHEPDAQMGRAWHFTLVDAVDALEVLCERLENLLDHQQRRRI